MKTFPVVMICFAVNFNCCTSGFSDAHWK